MNDYFYKVEEDCGNGTYIVLDRCFTTKRDAEAFIATLSANNRMRVVLYRTGFYDGPLRVEEETDA